MSGTLMGRVQAGDQEAFAELYRTHVGMVRAIVAHMIVRRADRPDVVQDVFTRVWAARARWTDQGRGVGAWIRVLTGNVCLDEIRRRGGRHILFVGEDTWQLDEQADSGNIEEELADRDEVHRALAGLTPIEREALEMFYLQDLNSAQMSAALGIAVQAARGRVFRARNKMGARIR